MHYADEIRLTAGGVVRAVLDLAAALARSGVRVTLLTGDASDAPVEWRSGGELQSPEVVEISRTLKPWARKKSDEATIERLVAETDIVHLHTLWDPFNRVVSSAATRAEKPWILTAHGMLDDHCMDSKPLKKRAYLALGGERWIGQSSRVHFTATGERDQSVRRVPTIRPAVLPLVIDLPPLEALPDPEIGRAAVPASFAPGEPVVLFLGRVHPIKGLDGLIEAFASVIRSGTAAQLLIVGPSEPGYDKQLESHAAKFGLSQRVHFLGMVGSEVKQSLYQACDLYALPSHHENFGLALVEAMACGTPALTTRSVNIWPEVESYGGTVVEDSVDGLTAGLGECLGNLADARERALAGRDGLREWLDPKRIGEQYAELYREVIAEGSSS